MTPTAVAALLLLAVGPRVAEGQRFIEVSRQTQNIDSEFDDSILLTSPDYTVNIPALQEAEGIGFAFGGWSGEAGVSFTYVRTDAPTTSVLGDTIAAHRAYGLDFAFAPWLGDRTIGVSPLFRFGSAYTTLNLPGEASDGATLDDASFSSLSLILGAGGMVKVGGVFHVTADYSRRYLKFHDVGLYDETIDLADGLSATGDVISIALAVYLPG